ncbi:RNA polymerase sigma factor [Luteolibacter soli]|uniref:Sigma-70 family RNA polymerase sigma factor n=1 Tax=Luteolibacter soli TaxID=3135280 RepID=A0ABU9APB0_9BACT
MPADPLESQSPDPFPKTRWSMVWGAQGDDPAALAELCKAYWFPLYCYARRITGNRDDANDLTQSFFEMLLTQQSLKSVSAERGKLRAFLLTALKNHAAGQHRRDSAQKRGGSMPVVMIDALSAEQRYALEPHENLSPEKEFDRAWARQLLASVLTKLGEAYREAGKGNVFDALHDHLTGGETEAYADAAESLGLSQAAVRYAAFKLRERYRTMLREAILDTVTSDEEAAEEMSHLRCLFSD